MTDEELLRRVKTALGITGEFQDETLTEYINEVKAFMEDAGVKTAVLEGDSIAGVVARGVSDLWNYGAGSAGFSSYFMQRVTQLTYREAEKNGRI